MATSERYTLAQRKNVLIPGVVGKHINSIYKRVWGPGGERGPEKGNPYEEQLKAFWIGSDDKETKLLDTLPQKVEAVVRSGGLFRMMDVGSASYAHFLTGYEPTSYKEHREGNVIHTYPEGVREGVDSINHYLIRSGFKPGKHYELIAVNGHSFAIPETLGVKLITSNIYGPIPGISKSSINLITSFRTVYQEIAGFYILERFDRYLVSSVEPEKNGLAVVWPFRQPITIVVDPDGRETKISTVMQMAGVHYWDPGEHASWNKSGSNLCFPLYASEFLEFQGIPPALVYTIQSEVFKKWVNIGREVTYEENPRLESLRGYSHAIYKFTPHTS